MMNSCFKMQYARRRGCRCTFIFLFLSVIVLGPTSLVLAREKNIRVQLFSRLALQEISIFTPRAQLSWAASNGEEKIIPLRNQKIHIRLHRGLLQLSRASDIQLLRRIELRIPSGSFAQIEPSDGSSQKITDNLLVALGQGGLSVFQELPLESYVAGVLGSELPADTPMEALKAQAVLIRTYAKSPRHVKEGFDFCDSTHCQAYRGGAPSLADASAVQMTSGLILTYQSKPIEALYHSSCGGHTSPNQKVFGGRPLDYLQGVEDGSYCQEAPQAHWESRVSFKNIQEILKEGKGTLREIRVTQGENSGRVYSLDFLRDEWMTLSSQEFLLRFGSRFGWEILKSAWFELKIDKDEVVFKGRGLGHGVGLCQWGARGMALTGKKFNEILAHYFPGTRLKRS